MFWADQERTAQSRGLPGTWERFEVNVDDLRLGPTDTIHEAQRLALLAAAGRAAENPSEAVWVYVCADGTCDLNRLNDMMRGVVAPALMS